MMSDFRWGRGSKMIQNIGHHLCMIPKRASKCGEINFLLENFQEKFEWIEEPVDKTIKQGSLDEVTFACKLSHKGKKAKWYLRNQVRNEFLFLFFSKSVPLCRSNLFTRGCNSDNSGVLRQFHLYS